MSREIDFERIVGRGTFEQALEGIQLLIVRYFLELWQFDASPGGVSAMIHLILTFSLVCQGFAADDAFLLIVDKLDALCVECFLEFREVYF